MSSQPATRPGIRRPGFEALSERASGSRLPPQRVNATLRVLHAPTAVGGHPGGLARAERELGLDSTSVSLLPHPFGHDTDVVLGRDGDGAFRRYVNRARLLSRMRRRHRALQLRRARLPIPHGKHGPIATIGRVLALRDLALLLSDDASS